jgi:hypothetical protein
MTAVKGADDLVDIILGESWRQSMGEQQPVGEAPGHLIEANTDELTAGLAAAQRDTVDVTVLFDPARLAIFADHDEYDRVRNQSGD